MTTDTGTALAAAIVANPVDDAPWLIYADYLDETGQAGPAAAIRNHLPAVRSAVLAGYDLATVLGAAGAHPPGTPPWDQAFGAPPPAPQPVVPAAAPAQLRVSEANERSWRAGIVLVYFVCAAVPGLATLLFKNDRSGRLAPVDVSGPGISAQETRRLIQAAEDGTAGEAAQRLVGIQHPVPPVVPVRWNPAELVGYSFRPADPKDRRVITFRADGTAEQVEILSRGQVRNSCRWKIDDGGVLEVTGTSGERWFRLVKVRAIDNRFEVTRYRVPEVYLRERP